MALFGACRFSAAQLPENALPLRIFWTGPDHASGIYHVKSDAALTVIAENPTDDPRPLSGEIQFGTLAVAPAEKAAGGESVAASLTDTAGAKRFSLISVTPIGATRIAAHGAVKIPLKLTFSGAGTYRLQIHGDDGDAEIQNSEGMTLQCIFAPRATTVGAAALPWLTALPRPAVRVPGYLADFMGQTSIRRFLIDERFAFDAGRGVALGFGASLESADHATGAGGGGGKRVDEFFQEAAAAHAELVLRVTVPIPAEKSGGDPAAGERADHQAAELFARYLEGAAERSGTALAAVAIVPEFAESASEDRRAFFQRLYLSGAQALKQRDRNVVLLGAGSAAATRDLLFPGGNGQDDGRKAVDAIAVTNAADEMNSDHMAGSGIDPQLPALPLWVLPPVSGSAWIPPAAALSAGARVAYVSAPEVDRGVTAQLFNGTSFAECITLARPPGPETANVPPEEGDPVSATNPAGTRGAAANSASGRPAIAAIPFIAVFQGDGYSVAAVAGPGAGTSLDAAFPALARTPTEIEPLAPVLQPPVPHLTVDDDSHSMRVVNEAGEAVDCRTGDTLDLPISTRMIYLLAGGSAEDLAGSLSPARPAYFPAVEISRSKGGGGGAAVLVMRNISPGEISGKIRALIPPSGGGRYSRRRCCSMRHFRQSGPVAR